MRLIPSFPRKFRKSNQTILLSKFFNHLLVESPNLNTYLQNKCKLSLGMISKVHKTWKKQCALLVG